MFASPYRITRAYAASLVDGVQRHEEASGQRREVFALPPAMLFMNRLQFGFYSVLARLDVEVDYAAVERRFLHAAGLV